MNLDRTRIKGPPPIRRKTAAAEKGIQGAYARHPENAGKHCKKNKKGVTELQESKKKQSCHGPYQTTLLL
jgi:hypothetical protein